MTAKLKNTETVSKQKIKVSPPVQVYTWPEATRKYLQTALFTGLFLSIFGLAIIVSTIRQLDTTVMQQSLDSGWLAVGLIVHVFGLMGMIGAGLYLYSLASEVRFTMDSVVISQPLRKQIILPLNEYNFQWMSDCRGNGNIRLIMLEANRGCTIVQAPKWVHEAFEEIGRIQEQEGWYEPANP